MRKFIVVLALVLAACAGVKPVNFTEKMYAVDQGLATAVQVANDAKTAGYLKGQDLQNVTAMLEQVNASSKAAEAAAKAGKQSDADAYLAAAQSALDGLKVILAKYQVKK